MSHRHRATDGPTPVDRSSDRKQGPTRVDGPKRRAFLKLVGASGIAPALGTEPADAAGRSGETSWSIVVLPDTQGYADHQEHITHAIRQTEWIVDHLESESIVFVTHEGDVAQRGDAPQEWTRMDAVMKPLDGRVAYSVVPGDHDWFVEADRRSATRYFRQYFGASRYRDREWFGGTGPYDLSHYQRFSAGGYEFLHLGLEWEAPGDADNPDTPLGWAQSVLDRHPDRPTIVTTHSYLRDGHRPGRTTSTEEKHGNGSSGEKIWQEIVQPNPQVFMVLCGNSHEGQGTDDGEYRQVSENEAGLPVFELLADYQDYPEGGSGWLRLIRFTSVDGGNDRIEVRTYSPSLDQFQSDDSSQFGFQLDFDGRFGPFTERRMFRQDVNGYRGTVDTYLQEAEPRANNGDAPTGNVDADDPQGSGREVQALLRFEDVIGDGDGQVPPGASTVSATLRLTTTDEGDGGAFHRMHVGWDEGANWNTFGGDGINADGEVAASSPDATAGPVSVGRTTIDVTDSVRAWVEEGSNDGWAILPRGGNGWDFDAADGAEPPELTVRYR